MSRPMPVSKSTYWAELSERLGVGLSVEHTREGVRRGIVRLRDHPEEREAMGLKDLASARGEYNWARQERGPPERL